MRNLALERQRNDISVDSLDTVCPESKMLKRAAIPARVDLADCLLMGTETRSAPADMVSRAVSAIG